MPPRGRLDDIAGLAGEDATVRSDSEAIDVLADERDELGRD
jgi:hypothetical protein